LADRDKDRLDVSGICEPKINSHAIDRLVMKSESIKALIKAVCQSYSSVDHQMKGFSADFFEGKGEGHIFLLHGPPGTGKTLTAGEYIFYNEWLVFLLTYISRVSSRVYETTTSQYHCCGFRPRRSKSGEESPHFLP
jgi:hypothetical protein